MQNMPIPAQKHEITYLLAQCQRYTTASSSSEAQAFFTWLHRSLVGSTSGSRADLPMPPGFVRPLREADGTWTDPALDALDWCQIEWWQETDDLLGIWHQKDGVGNRDHLRFYRVPRTALALYRLARWSTNQTPPVPAVLHQSVQILAQALVPGRDETGEAGQQYALLRMGNCCYVVLVRTPDLASGDDPFINSAPVVFVPRSAFREGTVPDGQENEHGHLFFRDAVVALSWFIEHYTLHAWGYLLSPTDELLAGPPKQPGPTRSPLPDLDQMKRYQAELEADATTPTLREEERQERIAFLMHATVQIQRAIPPGSIQALAQGLENLLEKLQARQHLQPPPQE